MRINKYRGETITLATAVTAAQVRGIPLWANAVQIEAPSATLENITLTFGPPIRRVYFYDASLTEPNRYIDLTSSLIDRNTSTGTAGALNSMQTADFIYIGCTRQFRGLAVDVTNTNSTTSTIALDYSGRAGVWTSLSSPTDGTASGGASFAQDGAITWTVPGNWVSSSLTLPNEQKSESLYWVRISQSAALDATVSIVELAALGNQVVNAVDGSEDGYAGILIQSNNRTLAPYEFYWTIGEYGSIDLVSTAITSAANVNWYAIGDS